MGYQIPESISEILKKFLTNEEEDANQFNPFYDEQEDEKLEENPSNGKKIY